MSENTHTPAPHRVTVDVGGRTLTLETGKIAKQANGAIVARYGDTVVLTTACMAPTANDRDFLPLTVDYRENTYSAGKIPGGFFKREGRPSEKEVLTSRLIDRPMRPLFPESWRNETQVVSMVLSADSENDPDVIAVTSASAAAYCSDLPFEKPIACVRVGLVDGQLVINPTVADQKKSLMNIIIAGTDEAIVMVESGALEVSEEAVADALEFGHAQIKKIVSAIKELYAQLKPKKVAVAPLPFDEAIYKDLQKKYGARHFNSRHQGRHAAPCPALRAGPVQALHVALQLPAVQRGRSQIPARPRPSRNRPRRPCRARAHESAACRGGLPLRHAPRFRHFGIQWLFLDGHRLRRFARPYGRGRAPEGSLRGHRHGPRRR